MYVTNQNSIVAHAKWCYENCHTIVNNIPKESNVYNNTLDDFALLDNKLSASQTDIGESSNLAQIAQTYSYNFDDEKFNDYVCILSVLAQIAIDSSKRLFDVNVTEEIKRIKKDMKVEEILYPKFWKVIKHGFKDTNINNELVCPMNYLEELKFDKVRSSSSTLPISEFFIKHELEDYNKNRHKSKKVESLIQEFSLKLYEHNVSNCEKNEDDYLLIRSDFDKLIENINTTYISKNYLDLMSWLINRTFLIGAGVKRNSVNMQSALKTNRPILLKVLYTINKDLFLQCFYEKHV